MNIADKVRVPYNSRYYWTLLSIAHIADHVGAFSLQYVSLSDELNERVGPMVTVQFDEGGVAFPITVMTTYPTCINARETITAAIQEMEETIIEESSSGLQGR